MTSISMKWVEDNHACQEAREWFKGELNGKRSMPVSKLFSRLVEIDRFNWANWLVVRLMTHDQQIMYAIYASEQVVGLYEDKYPEDTRPRDAIQAAKTCLEKPTKANKAKAADAATAAYAAAYSAYSAYAAHAADSVAHAAAYAAHAVASSEMRIQILNYGLGLIGVKAPKKAVEEG